MITEMLEEIKKLPGCALRLSRGPVPAELAQRMPLDLVTFYENCDGVELFLDQPFGFRLVRVVELQSANRIIFGEDYYRAYRHELESDLTSSWYVIAVGSGAEERVSIDLGGPHCGYCYDSFWDIHGSPDCPIIARSFTELLRRLIDAKGKVLYWKAPDAPDYGFAR